MKSSLKDKTCCFTGHRKLPKKDMVKIEACLEKEITNLIKSGFCYFAAGGAQGFDTVAEQSVLHLKEKYPHIKLFLILPCRNQAERWDEQNKRLYEHIKSKSDKVIYTSDNYFRGCMHKRNRYLADISTVCISYLTKKSGGTVYTVNYAHRKGLKVINIAERTSEKSSANNSIIPIK